MTTERSVFDLTILLPNKVKPKDLAEISRYRQQGRSLSEGVALVIVNEGKRSLKKALAKTDPKLESQEWKLRELDLIQVWSSYTNAAYILLNAEIALRGGPPIPFPLRIRRVINEAEDFFEKQPPDIQIKGKNQIALLNLWPLLSWSLGEFLKQQTITPEELVDFCVFESIRSAVKSNLPNYLLLIKVREQSRQRFHQLYTAAQELAKE